MPTYSIAEAKDNLSKLIDEAEAGEEVAIACEGKIVAYVRSAVMRAELQPSRELVAKVTARAGSRLRLEEPAAQIIRRMRDEREESLLSGRSEASQDKPKFSRYIGVDYSGAETPEATLPGLQAFLAVGNAEPTRVAPPQPRRNWSRRALAEWLIAILAEDIPTLVGIDHAFSFPRRYFEKYGLAMDWPTFLDDFQRHWPTDEGCTYVDFIRDGTTGDGAARLGDSRWRRLTEQRAGAAKSVFHFDVPGSVAKSSHAGIPWLRAIRARLNGTVRFWPFDGWTIPEGHSVVVEVYPALWSGRFSSKCETSHEHDAYCVAAWMAKTDQSGRLGAFLNPDLSDSERAIAKVEGWILGVAQSR
jgi:antitoxin (DNA-binding transcriptional repressor) of toxin-antitoxin stability system